MMREKSGMRQSRVPHRANMAARQHKPVPLGPGRILRIILHDAKIKGRKHVGHTQRSGRVPGFGRDQHLDDVLPYFVSFLFQFSNIHIQYFLNLIKAILVNNAARSKKTIRIKLYKIKKKRNNSKTQKIKTK